MPTKLYRYSTVRAIAPTEGAVTDPTLPTAQTRPLFQATISSENPVVRYTDDGVRFNEILSHKPDAVNFSRLKGLPLLLQHDQSNQIGATRDVAMVDGALTAKFLISRSREDIQVDLEDGIRENVSIGYNIDQAVVVPGLNGDMDLIVTKWTLLEASLVSVPADASVGVGRSVDDKVVSEVFTGLMQKRSADVVVADMQTNQAAAVAEAKIDAVDEVLDVALQEQGKANQAITDPVAAAEVLPVTDKGVATTVAVVDAPVAPAEPVVAPEDTQTRSVDVKSASASIYECDKNKNKIESKPTIQQRNQTMNISLLVKQVRAAVAIAKGQFSAPDVIEATQISDNLRAFAPGTSGILIPVSKRAYSTASVSADSAGIATQTGDLIDIVRETARASQVGVQVLDGLRGDVLFPVNELSVPAQWVSEGNTSGITAGTGGFSSKKLTKQTLTAQVVISNELIQDAYLDVNSIIQAEVTAKFAQAIDIAVFAGTGINNQPTGILNAAGTGSYDFEGAAPDYADIIGMSRAFHRQTPTSTSKYIVTTPEVAEVLMKTPAFQAGTTAAWAGDFDMGTVAGIKATTSSLLPVVGGVNPIILGDFSQVIVGTGGAMQVNVDTHTRAVSNETVLTFTLYAGVLVKRPASFVCGTDLVIA